MEQRRLCCFPPEDLAFCAAVESCAAEFGHSAGDPPTAFARYLRSALRYQYPGVVVIEQHPLARLDGGPPVVYVYRDGHLSHERPRDTPGEAPQSGSGPTPHSRS
jgi:hypothetical protein